MIVVSAHWNPIGVRIGAKGAAVPQKHPHTPGLHAHWWCARDGCTGAALRVLHLLMGADQMRTIIDFGASRTRTDKIIAQVQFLKLFQATFV